LEFGSEAYMQELMKRVNSDPVFLDLRKTGRNATYTLRLEREPENGVRADLTFGFEVVDGKIKEVWTGGNRTTQFTDLVFSGKYGVWVDLLRDRLKITDALLARKLTLRGETDEIYGPTVWMSPGPLFGMSLTAATERIVEIARTIPTEFHGNYASQSTGH
jgi:hypothetical protein